MFYQTEAKPQCWRAVAVFDDRPEQLLYLNRSSTQVRAGFRDPYFDLLDVEEARAREGSFFATMARRSRLGTLGSSDKLDTADPGKGRCARIDSIIRLTIKNLSKRPMRVKSGKLGGFSRFRYLMLAKGGKACSTACNYSLKIEQ